MKQGIFEITENVHLTDKVCRMTLSGDASAITCPGQFADLKIDGFFLRRPFSVMDYEENRFSIGYKIAGDGTEKLSGMRPGDRLDVLTGLGNGFDFSEAGHHPLFIAGGSGVSPIYCAAKHLPAGIHPQVVLGFNTASEIYAADELRAMGAEVQITTVDGSCGRKGFAAEALDGLTYSYVFCCGPVPMMKAVNDRMTGSGQFSFEARMGCGYGACMGCTCKTAKGYKRVCKDGPVLRKEEILWE